MTEKDYSLLRPFDLDAAKAGAKLFCINSKNGETECTFIQKAGDELCIHFEMYGFSIHDETDSLRMAPLCWVEGKPVYPGDVLWQGCPGGDVFERTVKGLSNCGNYLVFEGFGAWATDGTVSVLTWGNPRPKPVKRWINIYPNTGYDTKAAADQAEVIGRIACIEIELPPLKL